MVTPAQLAGDVESWDYGVGLPAEELTAWQIVRLRSSLRTDGWGAYRTVAKAGYEH